MKMLRNCVKKTMKIRLATFRSVLSRDAQRILQHSQFDSPDKREDLPSVIEALQRHFVLQRNEAFERYVFNTAVQESGESVDDYVTRLRRLAATCNFNTTANNLSYEDRYETIKFWAQLTQRLEHEHFENEN